VPAFPPGGSSASSTTSTPDAPDVTSVLPIGGYLLVVLALAVRGLDWRRAVLAAAIAWAVMVVLLDELLSLWRALSPVPLAVAWLAADAVALFAVVHGWRGAWRVDLRGRSRELDLPHTALLSAVGLVVVLVGLTAIVSPPNTWDAMRYHMPRLVRWLDQQSVGAFATHDLRQLFLSPGAEFLRVPLHALAGGDRLDNLVQWGAYAASAIVVSLVAGSLGAGLGGQVLAAVLVATIPQGILQASGAKSDWVLSLWLLALVQYLLEFRRRPSTTLAAAAAAAVGLACLTKGTAYLFIPAVAVPLFMTWPGDAFRAFLRRLPVAAAVVIALVGGHTLRTYLLFDTPLGPSEEDRVTARAAAPSAILSTVLRNAALHLGTPSDAVNDATTVVLERAIRALGGDPNDPRTTWKDTRFRVPAFSRQEDTAGNPVHLALIVVALVGFAFARFRRRYPEAAACAVGLLVAFLAFCAGLRWQPWHTRLHLPLFILWAAPVGVLLGRSWPRLAVWSVGALLVCLSIPFALGNASRPLAWPGERSVLKRTRTEMYFAERPDLAAPFLAAARAARQTGCRRIGLPPPASGQDDFDYPLIALLRAGRPDVRVVPIDVGNVSSPSFPTIISSTNRFVTRAATAAPAIRDGGHVCAVVCLACVWDPRAYPTEGRMVWSDASGLVMAGSWPVINATVRMTVDEHRARPGQRITVGVTLQTAPDGPAAELVAGVVLPDRRSATLVDASGAFGPPFALDQPFHVPPRPIPPGFRLREPAFAQLVVPATAPPGGTYQVFVALVRHDAARRGRLDFTDFLAWDGREIVAMR
jgi:hypothetical protein